jgi:hypothetical protein
MNTISLSAAITLNCRSGGFGGATLSPVDYRGRFFNSDLRVDTDPFTGPGWYIFARDATTEVIKNIARPEGGLTSCRKYTTRRHRGWDTMKEAQAWVDIIAPVLKDLPPAVLYLRSVTISG